MQEKYFHYNGTWTYLTGPTAARGAVDVLFFKGGEASCKGEHPVRHEEVGAWSEECVLHLQGQTLVVVLNAVHEIQPKRRGR